MNHRNTKNVLYEQVARVGKAFSSPKRLEMLDLLAQGEKSVEVLAAALSIGVKLASAHLKTLREARLVMARREGTFMYYRVSGPDVASLGVSLREVALEHLLEMQLALQDITLHPSQLKAVDRQTLLNQAQGGQVVVIDVRPLPEYAAGHLPYARSIPLAELAQRLAILPSDKEIVAYCRGPFCLMSDEAVALLKAKGFRARKISDGISEWRAAGFALESSEAITP